MSGLRVLPYRVATITPGYVSGQIARPTTHIRMWEWHQPAPERPLEYIRTDYRSLLKREELKQFHAVIVQRNTLPDSLAGTLAEVCRRFGVCLVHEIDDDLFQVPAGNDPDRRYETGGAALERFVRGADLVLTSTAELRARLSAFNANCRVVENRLGAATWFSPLASSGAPAARPPVVQAVYMGTATHLADLEIVRQAFETLREEVRLHVVCSEPLPESSWYDQVLVPEDCQDYPRFVPWFRAFAATMDFAVAPLLDTHFNNAKSHLKFLEYGAAKLPGIYSDVTPYRDIVHRSGIGTLAGGDWEAPIRAMCARRAQLPEEGRAAKDWVRRNACIEDATAAYDALIVEAIEDSVRGRSAAAERGADSAAPVPALAPRAAAAPSAPAGQIAVLSMHRSGSSALMSLLAEMGAYAGTPEELLPPQQDNLLGFYERNDIHEICRQLLNGCHADWWRISAFDPAHLTAGRGTRQREAIRQVIAKLDANGTWAVKEPRLCLTLPAFLPFMENAKVIFLVRQPMEIAQSLEARNGFDLRFGLALWEAYMVHALNAIRGLPCLFVSHADLMHNPVWVSERIQSWFPGCGLHPVDRRVARSLIRSEMIHHTVSEREAGEVLTGSQNLLWRSLRLFAAPVADRLEDAQIEQLSAYEQARQPPVKE